MERLNRVRRLFGREHRPPPDELPLDPAWERPDLWHLFQLYKVCMARVGVEMPDGTFANGAAFHIGDGYMVTARHVVEDGTVVEIVPEPFGASPQRLTIVRTFVPDDPKTDLAILAAAARMIEADRRERARIAQKRATNPRYDPKIHGG